jgi:hypothetical protein
VLLGRLPVLMSVIRSSKEPARARAGQALTRAPMGPWPRPCARLVGSNRGQDSRTEAPARQWWYGPVAAVGVEDEHAGGQDQPIHGEGHQAGGYARLPVSADQLVAVGDHGCHRGDGSHGGSGGDPDEPVCHASPFLNAASSTICAPSRDVRAATA